MIRAQRSGEWVRAGMILGAAPVAIRGAMDRAVLAEAQLYRRKVVEGFRTQAPGGQSFAPLSPLTLKMRKAQGFGGTKALVVRGDLRNSVKVVKRRSALGSEAFVGVLRSARGKDGQGLFNVAAVHEFGSTRVMEVTPKMHAFVMASITDKRTGGGGRFSKKRAGGSPRGTGNFKPGRVIVIRIPPRPFLRPVAEEFFSGPVASVRFKQRLAANLAGLAGGLHPRTVGQAIRVSDRPVFPDR